MSDDTPDTNFKVIDTRSPETRARVAGDHVGDVNEMVGEELKPCPFCGKEPTVGYTEYWKAYDVHCDCELGPSTEMHTREEVIAAWNRRAPEPMTSVVRWTRYTGKLETLPKKDRDVLIVVENSIVAGTCRVDGPLLRVISGYCSYVDFVDCYGNGRTWAYLPQPPEGAE